ncbi:MAG: DNA methyltransferase [Gemmatimonadaceae bacterium]
MNAVEIEEAVSQLFAEPFDWAEFPYRFLEAFGNKETTIRRLRKGDSNKSDVGGVLQANNIHIAVAPSGEVTSTLAILRESTATTRHKVKFILATDGETVEAEEVPSGDPVACAYADLPNHFGYFLPLAGITTVREIKENSFDIRATSRLNRLYLELLRLNPEWGTEARRHDMNHFMARLIFCFFAEDTDIFDASARFTQTVERMSEKDSSNTHEIISALFLSMNTARDMRESAGVPRWAHAFPYVNGGLFSGSTDVPTFSKIARSYLLHIGSLDWTRINPDIFGSMIQAVADDEERGALGMHYTSVPNILKVLNPLFLDELRARLEEAGTNARMLLNLRKRMARIRVFDPACGSGNFLVIGYKHMREIESEINRRRGETGRKTDIPLTNFRGIELRDFPAEIARLALIIAEYQCDVLYRGKTLALADFLPLDSENWITCGNALRLDWVSICPPTGTGVKIHAEDLFSTPLDQSEIDFDNAGGETYICGNPPYLGSSLQSAEHKSDLRNVFKGLEAAWKELDYVAAWFIQAARYCNTNNASFAFVSTNSICQGKQVAELWPEIFRLGHRIAFAITSFKWNNLATNKAGVTVVIVGVTKQPTGTCRLMTVADTGSIAERIVGQISAYLTPNSNFVVSGSSRPISDVERMDYGSKPADGGHLILTTHKMDQLSSSITIRQFLAPYVGSTEFIEGRHRFCFWIADSQAAAARTIPELRSRIEAVHAFRIASTKKPTRDAASRPHAFAEIRHHRSERLQASILIPIHTGEGRDYLPVGVLPNDTVVSNAAFAIENSHLWSMSIIASRLHWIWIATVCGRIKMDFRYSNTLGWNTFPVPTLTEKNKSDLTRCAEDILLVRESHFPATIADLYDPDKMPSDLREAHSRNDETLERIYIGRRFKNDTERLEKLFDMYAKMTAAESPSAKRPRKKA